MDYQLKYLKYKKKYFDLKNKLGGAASVPKMKPPKNRQFIGLSLNLRDHDDISKLGPKKPIATGHSGGEPGKLKQKWLALDDENKEYLTKYWFPNNKKLRSPKQTEGTEDIELGVFVPEEDRSNGANPIVFYSVPHLGLLSEASGKTIEELLEIVTTRQVPSPDNLNYDIMLIAFGDPFRKSQAEKDISTPEGKKILKDYIDLAGIEIDELPPNTLANYNDAL